MPMSEGAMEKRTPAEEAKLLMPPPETETRTSDRQLFRVACPQCSRKFATDIKMMRHLEKFH